MEIEKLNWVQVPPELKSGLSRQTLSKRKLKHWTLVLQSRQIPCRTEKSEKGLLLLVPADQFQQACQELIQYEKENHNWPPPPPPDQKLHENTASTLWVLIFLVLFHNVTTHQVNLFGHNPYDWIRLGNVHGAKILAGEWWRLVTALTLHSGPLHLAGNVVAGGIFIVRLCWILGSGPAWLLVLASGILGNLLNILVQSPDHRSIGASTAVFGAVGLLATINMLRYRQSLWRRWPLPIAAAFGLLALLGTGGENTDIGAHLFGFLSGIGLGLMLHYLPYKVDQLSPLLNRSLASLSALLVLVTWWFALN
ncbi:MAG: rhomboid family intramembrane serine protease [Deltaproteobacteria bacterium]|nr:rhomboid family intramembrane serine protease [Deltaproteobacteria bacterium]